MHVISVRGYKPCPDCHGAASPRRLAVKVGGMDIAAVSGLKSVMPGVLGAWKYCRSKPVVRGSWSKRTRAATCRGLGSLSALNWLRGLSGEAGDDDRARVGLVNTLDVLDEPSVGLQPHDVGRMIAIIKGLRGAGNTVVGVENDQGLIRAADLLVDMGPGAGESGGQLLYVGPPGEIEAVAQSMTGGFLSGRRKIAVPERRRPRDKGRLRLTKARGHNLKNIDVEFPLGVLCVVAGVSGSGKSTLVEETLYPALRRRLGNEALAPEPFGELIGTGDLDDTVLIDQTPIGRSARSNPVTYLKAFDEIRKTFAASHEAKLRNYGASRFSFNVEGGRCDACEGNGFLTVDMQFLPDVMIRCPDCRGTRYRRETLEVTYRGNIAGFSN